MSDARLAGAAAVLVLGGLLAGSPARAGGPVLPRTLTDVQGTSMDVHALAARRRLVVVTIKASWCPVCREQLRRLAQQLPRLESCGATFLVLGPGPARDLRALQRETEFPYPFVEDVDLAIARAADLVLDENQITPALLAVDRTGGVVWMQRGRSGAAFGDRALLEHLDCAALRTAAVH